MPKTEIFNRVIVLQKAGDVFHTKGYNATSMQDLVDATGLNRSSIYNSFGNKHGLFLECLKVYHNESQKAIASKLFNDDPIKGITSLFQYLLEQIMLDKENKGCLIANCTSEMANQDDTINYFLQMNQNDTLTLFTSLVEKGQQLGVINNKQSATNYALYLYASIQGLRMSGILLDNKTQLQGLIDTTLQNLN